MRKIKKRLKMSKFEKLLYTLALFLLVISPISIVFSKATLANVNYEVEKQKQKIEEQQKTNESLAMTINELASLTKIQEVAEEQGLSYNNNNIKTVTEDEKQDVRKLTKQKKRKKNNIRYSKIVIFTSLFLFAAMIGRVIQLGLSPEVDGINLKELASKRTTATETLSAERGSIYTKDG